MLTIYAPFNNKNSKAWEVFNGVEKSWPEQITKRDNAIEKDPVSNSMFWGFVGNNREMVPNIRPPLRQRILGEIDGQALPYG